MRKNQLFAAISVLLVTGFLLTSLTSYFVSRNSLRKEIETSQLPLTSDTIYSEIQRDLLRPVFISSLMASDTFLRDWVLDGEADEQKITKYLKEIQTSHNTFTSFFVSEKTSRYYHSSGLLKHVSPEEERDAWYYRVRRMGTDFEINVDPDLANMDSMTIFVNYKVYDYDKNFIGATGVGLTVNAAINLIEDYQNKYGRSIYFIDRTGAIKLASRGTPAAKNISEIEGLSGLLDAIIADKDHSHIYRKDGKTVHLNSRFIDEFGWYLLVGQTEGQAFHQISRTLFVNLSIFAVITSIILIFTYLTIRSYQQRIETLKGIVPICSHCKQIRDDKGYWNSVEAYVARYTEAEFSHGICPECLKKHYPELADETENRASKHTP